MPLTLDLGVPNPCWQVSLHQPRLQGAPVPVAMC